MAPTLDPRRRADALFERLRAFEGAPREFWPLYLEAVVMATGAALASLHVPLPGPDGRPGWVRLGTWSSPEAGRLRRESGPGEALLTGALAEGLALEGPGAAGEPARGAFRLPAEARETASVVALVFFEPADRAAAMPYSGLLAALVAHAFAQRAARQLQREHVELTEALDLRLQLDRERKFLPAAMLVCNELAARLRAERVSLGWVQEADGIVQLRAMSQAEKFEKRVQIVRALEVAMEEALAQDADLAWPPADAATAVTRDHAHYAREAGSGALLSLPLRVEGRPVAVLLAERLEAGFTPAEVHRLRLALDQAARRVADLHDREHFSLRRVWRAVKTRAAWLLQPQHTGAKLAVAAAVLALAFLFLGRLPYRVEASFLTRSDAVSILGAPFDGYIAEVPVRVGDTVPEGALLARFDTRELLLQQSAALANVNRHQQEMEKARAQGALADMRIAEAQAEQARAQLALTRHQLARAEIRAPFAGAVVEGDLRKRVGAPFRQGDTLFQLARLDALYVELEVPERDAHEILAAREAVIAFAADPGREFRVAIEQVHPAGQARPGGTVFLVRARLSAEAEAWWRPGLTGAARIQVGWRNPFWIFTHRTFDWLRLQLWW